MELVQSFIYSFARVKLSLYEQRIMLKIVEHAQVHIKGLWIKKNLTRVPHDGDNLKLVLQSSDILSDGSHHYEDVMAAVRGLESRQFEFFDTETNTWHATPIIYNARLRKGSGVFSFYVADIVYDVILDFTKGFSKYNLEKALALDSPYAVRLYAMVASQTRPLTLSVEELYKTFGVVGKYSQTADFLKKVIEPSRQHLDWAGLNSFRWEPVKLGRKIVQITLIPVKREPERVADLLAKLPVSAVVQKELNMAMMAKFGFSSRELGAHKAVLESFGKMPNWVDKLMEIEHRFLKGQKSKGYVINAIRGEVKDFFGQKS